MLIAVGSIITARWASDDSKGNLIVDPTAAPRPAIVNRLMLSDAVLSKGAKGVKRQRTSHVLVEVDWLARHPNKKHYGKVATVWGTTFQPSSSASFMPLQRILNLCALSKQQVTFRDLVETVNIVIPL